jgi:CBS domain-containing protein
MKYTLAACAPDASVAQVTTIMRNRDIGNMLVVEDGHLRGIVTDRDLALQALAGKDDPLQTPIRKFMSTKIVTSDTAWSLEQVVKIMSRHQIRCVPIVQDGQLSPLRRRTRNFGCVSGEARHTPKISDLFRQG